LKDRITNRNGCDLAKFNSQTSNSAIKDLDCVESKLDSSRDAYKKDKGSFLLRQNSLEEDEPEYSNKLKLSQPNEVFSLANEVKVASKKVTKDQIEAFDKAVKYLNYKRQLNNLTKYTNSGKLITSDGVMIDRGRMRSTTNASTSSQSTSKQRQRFQCFSSSVERRNVNGKERATSENKQYGNTSTILIQNFLININKNSYKKEVEFSDNEMSFDHTFTGTKNSNFKAKGINKNNLRKSHDQCSFPKMSSYEANQKFRISNYQERRYMRLQEKSLTKSERSIGKLRISSLANHEF
jgi:hypothetical protein